MTPTEQDKELFELCKQVYEATGWRDTLGYIQPFGQNVNFPNWFDETITKDHDIAPLYTSDYLLEKLQQSLKHKNDQITVFNDSKGWSAKLNINFIDGGDIYHYREVNDSYGHATPLLALLKLTLKLHEEVLL